MEAKMNKYDAFISYRHLLPDKMVAETIHKTLEYSKIPQTIKKRNTKEGLRTKITRVFRDEEELPLASNLEEPIIEALKNSEWLIVICTPKLKESKWCMKEIDTFIQYHDREHVLAVLAEGEPADSFPKQLTEIEKEITLEDGTTQIITESLEPFGLDARGKNDKERKRKIKEEIPRLLAPMFNVSYDDFKQRAKEHRFKKTLIYSVVAMIVAIIVAVVEGILATQIANQAEELEVRAGIIQNQLATLDAQSEEIEEQNNKLKESQALALAKDSVDYMNKDERPSAVLNAVYSLTEYQGIDMPESIEGYRALYDSMLPYGYVDLVDPYNVTEFSSEIELVKTLDAKYVLVQTDIGYMYVVDSETGKIVYELPEKKELGNQNFLPTVAADNNGNILYCMDGIITKVNIDTSDAEIIIDDSGSSSSGYLSDYACYYLSCVEGLIIYGKDEEVFVYDENTLEQRASYSVAREGYVLNNMCVVESDIILFQFDGLYLNSGVESIIVCYSISENAVKYVINEDEACIMGLCVDSGILFVSTVPSDKMGATDEHSNTVKEYDIYTGEIIAQKENLYYAYSQQIGIVYEDDIKYLAVNVYNDVMFYDIDNDFELYGQYVIGQSFEVDFSSGYVCAFMTNGEVQYISPSNEFPMTMASFLNCKVSDYDLIVKNTNGYLAWADDSNKLLLYKYDIIFDSCEPVDASSVSVMEPTNDTIITVKDDFQSLGIPDYEYVRYAMFINDGKYLAALKINGELLVYNAENMELISSDETSSASFFEYYLGKDCNGYEYIDLGFETCIIDDCGNILTTHALINSLTEDGESVLCYGKSVSYELPVMTKEELKEYAKEYLDVVVPGWDEE